jgi:hypothetical protein
MDINMIKMRKLIDITRDKNINLYDYVFISLYIVEGLI